MQDEVRSAMAGDGMGKYMRMSAVQLRDKEAQLRKHCEDLRSRKGEAPH